MSDSYTWSDMRDEGPSHLPGPDRLGWWVGIALLVAIVLHVLAFFALGQIKIALGFDEAEEMRTAPINVDQVEVLPPAMDDITPEPVAQEPENTASLLEEIDVLANLPEDHELDITPETIDPEFAIKPQQPLAEGAPEALELDISAEFDLASALPEMGRTENPLPLAAEGQVIVDPGAVEVNDPSLDQFTEEILKKGAGGNAAAGTLDGVVTLDDLVGLPENVLVGKKTMLPSDLLFEYNSAELRESARVGLMKLALLVERNPGLYCWIEGYTDLYGGDGFNLDLSQRRAKAVRNYLVEALLIDGEKIVTRGYGKSRPIIDNGTVDEQAPNRRVEIKMRRTLPTDPEPVVKEVKPEPKPEPEPPKAVLVTPMRDLEVPPVIEEPVEEPEPPKAVPVVEDPPRAVPVEESPPRAVPVGE
ncbi:hypothetical protein HAHE_16110 [Haloferula helveola]|uniref:OmpA-like domain-containing protein n=1 Tax=Haloferula helveola TaxID=490095 RepID=A0ABM7RD24_9BACT|nr:hypothetical protein HAHE_16110 [Haloferula helveola]